MASSFYPGLDTRHWNPLVGCDHGAKFGCLDHCWAAECVRRWGDGWGIGNSFAPRLVQKWWGKPLSWRKPQVVATGFLGDIACLTGDDIELILGIIWATPQHTYLLLTKDPARFHARLIHLLPPNVLMMATVRNQEDAARVIPDLLRIPAARYGLSLEPLLSNLDLSPCLELPDPYDAGVIDEEGNPDHACDRCGGEGVMEYNDCPESWGEDSPTEEDHLVECPECHGDGMNARWRALTRQKVSWIVAGCESGRGARWGMPRCGATELTVCQCEYYGDPPCAKCQHAEWPVLYWLRGVRDQCKAAGVSFWSKQCPVFNGGKWRVSSDLADFPPDLQVQERPQGHGGDK